MVAHPDYPDIDLKPPLALYYSDQTYDLVHLLDTGIALSILDDSNVYHFNVIANILHGKPILFSRFTVRNFPRKFDYCEVLYENLKQYSGCAITFDNIVANRDDDSLDFGVEQIEWSSFSEFFIDWVKRFQSVYYRNYYDVEVSIPSDFIDNPKNRIGISYLVDDADLDDKNFGGKNSTPFPITRYHWHNYIVSPKDIFNGKYKFVSKGNFSACSMTIYPVPNGDVTYDIDKIKDSFNAISLGFLSDNLQYLINLIKTEIDNNYPRLNLYASRRGSRTLRYTVRNVRSWREPLDGLPPHYQINGYYVSTADERWEAVEIPYFPNPNYYGTLDWEIIDSVEIEYKSLPTWIKKSIFCNANNNYGYQGIPFAQIEDEGEYFVTELNEDEASFLVGYFWKVPLFADPILNEIRPSMDAFNAVSGFTRSEADNPFLDATNPNLEEKLLDNFDVSYSVVDEGISMINGEVLDSFFIETTNNSWLEGVSFPYKNVSFNYRNQPSLKGSSNYRHIICNTNWFCAFGAIWDYYYSLQNIAGTKTKSIDFTTHYVDGFYSGNLLQTKYIKKHTFTENNSAQNTTNRGLHNEYNCELSLDVELPDLPYLDIIKDNYSEEFLDSSINWLSDAEIATYLVENKK